MTERRTVLTVGANPRNLDLLERYLVRAGFGVVKAAELAEVDGHLNRGAAADLAVVDVSEYDAAVWDRCRRIHEMGMPHLVLSGPTAEAIRERGIAGGAGAVLEKPVAIRRLIGLVRDLLEGAPSR